jgi:hypothetical protein
LQSIIIGSLDDAAGNTASVTLNYDAQSKTTSIQVTNLQTVPIQVRVAGFQTDGVTEDPAKTYLLTVPAGEPFLQPTNGAGSIQLGVNGRGKIAGFNFQMGGTIA